ncbi:MAG: Asp23/Gls24 family envelope stress response protein [Spirochaetia bacterium]|jgi:uncharacterized alkaline shock family protein YloU/adenylate kinase family enzyme|nr:Asp23/Gls24 family envelope stress response protein [Spirochaetia bacterium]
MKFSHYLAWLFGGIKVFALVGKSGTGKSFRAKLIAEKYGIQLIVDDGLLIHDNGVIAGKSAKKEKAFLGAIKTALFDDINHRKEVINSLRKTKFKRILLIGTSDRMVFKIAKRLKLPRISKIIYIEEIATQDEINKAIHSRNVEGKHIIPVPSVVIQRDYSHIIYDTVKVFMKKKFFDLGNSPKGFEKTIVTPNYSRQKGIVTISETALTQMIIHCADEFDQTIKINKVKVRTDMSSYNIKLYIQVPYMTQLSGRVHNFQQYVISSLEKYAGIHIKEVNVKIENFVST